MKTGRKLISRDSLIDKIHQNLSACISDEAWRHKVWTAVMFGLDPNIITRPQACKLLNILSPTKSDCHG